MIIYFFRHASAGQKKSNASQDEKRPLDKEGIEQCRYMGRVLANMDVQVDAIISSPLKRATQTASLVGNELGYDSKIIVDSALKPGADYEAFRQLLGRNAKYDSIMVVGHNPNFSSFASLLISGATVDNAIDLKKGAVAKVDFNGKKPATLNWCITPKIVREIYASAETNSRPNTVRK
jgi:phosphohistidine phosphatase